MMKNRQINGVLKEWVALLMHKVDVKKCVKPVSAVNAGVDQLVTLCYRRN